MGNSIEVRTNLSPSRENSSPEKIKETRKMLEVVATTQLASKALDYGYQDIDVDLNETKLRVRCR